METDFHEELQALNLPELPHRVRTLGSPLPGGLPSHAKPPSDRHPPRDAPISLPPPARDPRRMTNLDA